MRFAVKDLAEFVETAIGSFQTFGSVATRLRDGLTFVDVLFAIFPFVSRETLALIIFDEIDTFRSVNARSAQTIVDVDLAMKSVKSRVVTIAFVRIDSVEAESVVETW